jgi:DNA-directed RNA polymerase specialized sigma24 family protein
MLARLHAGEIEFDEFTRATEREWSALAAELLGRYEVPAAVGIDDVRQELLLAAWNATRRWGEGGISLKSWCVMQASNYAKGFIHRQRGALRHRGTAPSRHPVALSSFSEEREERVLAARVQAPTQERDFSRKETINAAIMRAESSDDALALLAVFRMESVDDGARLLYDDKKMRRGCGLKTRTEARALVRRALTRAVESTREESF